MFRYNKALSFIALMSACLSLKAQHQLSGQLVSGSDSSAVSAAVILLPELNLQSVSDAEGKFVFQNLPKGYCKLQVIKTGYISFSNYLKIEGPLTTKRIYLASSVSSLDEIIVYGNQQSKQSQTSNNIEVLDSKSMREQGAMSLSDGIAKLPGINQLSTGAGISKPVIRGLFGNRIQTVLLGMRFDNQQWQDEHGLGLSDIGVDRIEIIKGASSLLYGSEAMGGVLNIINEKPAPVGKTQVDIGSRFFSNTYGYGIDAGVKRSNEKLNWGIRFGSESHADYSDGNNTRILNSRFGGNLAKAFIGFKHKNWINETNYLVAQSNFGFLMDAYQVFDKPDDRMARSFEKPHHTVTINILSSQNTLFLNASKLKVNVGTHINNRQEQEGSGGISLDMLLKTYTALLLWEKNFNESTELSIGSQNQYQTNVNQGSRIIVPDANLGETSLFAYVKKQAKYVLAEGGLRYDLKNIHSLLTDQLNNGSTSNPGFKIVPVNNFYNTVNGSLGFSAFDTKHWQIKINATSGYRGPNLAELSSNGLHEGSLRYELGDVNLKIEQNFCVDLSAEYKNKWLSVFGSAYVNRFLNYIYLQPTNDDYLGFRIYRYVQKNATLQGLEGGIKLHPRSIPFVQLSATYSGIIGQTDAHEYLPFIPAQKINNEVKFKTDKFKKLTHCYFSINYIYVLAQNKANQFETATPSYQLINAGIGADWPIKNKLLNVSLSGNNLLNETYYDHLSRFKYFGIYNIGRSINLNLKFYFN